jgi:hypothetical protein
MSLIVGKNFMKIVLTILFLALIVCSFGQPKKFKNLDDYEAWMMSYYRNPEPYLLFNAFNYGVHNKKITKAGNNTMIIAFFSSALRKDTISQLTFYKKIGNTHDEELIYSFGLTLWQIHTDFSIALLDEFLNQDNPKKYHAAFDRLRAEKFINIWTDSISHPEHLDMLWTDFFVTGNEESIKKIISKLSDLNSKNYFDVATAGSAKWSLISNSIRHQKVLDICIRERETSDSKIKEALDEIIESTNKQRREAN